MSSKSRSRSRSRSGSRSPKRRSYKRPLRDESISPIRTASGANLRFTKARDGQNQFRRGNYNNYQRNYNNRGYYNQRNNYGNRWNRGRGNYQNQWNYNNRNNNYGRQRYNSRSGRSRSRSRSRSYDRDRSRSRSHSRSRSRDRRSRSKSYNRDRKRSASYSSRDRSRSKSPATKDTVSGTIKPIKVAPVEKKKTPEPPPTHPHKVEIAVESAQQLVTNPLQMRSRWESPVHSPNVMESQWGGQESQMKQDDIFDQWDDDKLREYLLKANTKKLAKEGKKIPEPTPEAQPPHTSPHKSGGKKKKKQKALETTPAQEGEAERGRKKKKIVHISRSSSSGSSSSSSSWSPIHKAPERRARTKSSGSSNSKIKINLATQEYKPPTTTVYAQQQLFPSSDERNQAVQYPFSHVQKAPAAPPAPIAPPAPVNQPSPAMIPGLGEIQIIGQDGKPIKLVPMSVPGPDGNMIQVMQIQQPSSAPAPPVAVPEPVPPMPSEPKSVYRTPPPPPSYPPPAPSAHGKYPIRAAPPAPNFQYGQGSYPQPAVVSNPNVVEKPIEQRQKQAPPFDEPSPSSGDVHSTEKQPHNDSMMEKQKRRQEVLRTRFKPRPVTANSTWLNEQKVKKEMDQNANLVKGASAASGVFDQDNSNKPKYKPAFGNHPIPSDANSSVVNQSTQHIPTLDPRQKHAETQRRIPIINRGLPPTRPKEDVKPPKPSPTPPTAPVIPPQLAAQGFKPSRENPQILVGPNGEMLQLISAPSAPAPPAPPAPVQQPPIAPPPKVAEPSPTKKSDGWTTAAEEFIRGKPERQEDSSSDGSSSDAESTGKQLERKRTISGGSDRKSKKKARSSRSSSRVEGDDDEHVSSKKKKKKKKKNKKKKEEQNEDGGKEKKKKKKQKKEKADSVENETLKSKKDWKGFNEANKRSKPDSLVREISAELPLSHIRAIVPRRKGEGAEELLGHINFDLQTKSSLAHSTSYEDRFVSLFGSGEVEPVPEVEPRVDITKKSVRKFKVSVQGSRSVSHMTKVSLSDRFKESNYEEDDATAPQKVCLNVSSLEKPAKSSKKAKSKSRSRSPSSSDSSQSRERPTRKYRKRSQSKSESKSASRSRSRSMSLPLAYSVDDKSGRQDSDLRDDIEKSRTSKTRSSRSRSRSWSSNEDRDRNRQRQPYHNNWNNNQYRNYNQRGRGQYNNRGYYNNRGRWGYNNRGNYNNRGRYQNWNQGYYNNNRNQNQRYQRYDNRYNRYDVSPDRTRRDRSSSRDRDEYKEKVEKSPQVERKDIQVEQKVENVGPQNDANTQQQKKLRMPSPAQWGHDLYEKHETEVTEEIKG